MFYFLYCSKCRRITKHKVEDKITDDNKKQVIECINCEDKQEDMIINKRVKILKIFGELYDRGRTKKPEGKTEN